MLAISRKTMNDAEALVSDPDVASILASFARAPDAAFTVALQVANRATAKQIKALGPKVMREYLAVLDEEAPADDTLLPAAVDRVSESLTVELRTLGRKDQVDHLVQTMGKPAANELLERSVISLDM